MDMRNGSSNFIETHARKASGTGAPTQEYAVHVPSKLTPALDPLTEERVAESERYGEGFIAVTEYGSAPSPRHPITGTRLTQDEPGALEGSLVSEDDSEPVESILEPSMSLTAGETSKQRLSVGAGRPYEKGNKAARAKKPKLAMLGINTANLDVQDERLSRYIRKAEYYLRRRSRELSAMFGYVSAGVSGILSSAAVQLAHAKYAALMATEAAGRDPKMYLELSKLAITLQNAARSNELAAYELCAKESGQAKSQIRAAATWLEGGNL